MEGKNINKFVALITGLFEGGGGGLIQTGGFFVRGGEGLFKLRKDDGISPPNRTRAQSRKAQTNPNF